MNATAALNWAKFFAAILPELARLGHELFERHRGHVAPARTELRALRDHGARLQAAEDALDARLDALRDREQS
jgi:hypothetical protein